MIPKILHHVWPGFDPFRTKFHAWRMSWMKYNADYTMMFWDLSTLPYNLFTSGAEELLKSDLTFIGKAEIAKYEITRALGGIYIDTDMECLKNFDPLLGVKSFCGEGHYPDNITNAIFATEAETDLMFDLCETVVASVKGEWADWHDPKKLLNTKGGMRTVGLTHFSMFEKIHPKEVFFPTWCLDSKQTRDAMANKGYNGAFAVHHWNGMEKDGWCNVRP